MSIFSTEESEFSDADASEFLQGNGPPKDIDRPARELDVLSPVLRQRLIDQQCAREQPPLEPSALSRVFAQCDSRPDRLAISTFNGTSLTYGELGQRITQLAQTIRGYGVVEGDIVF